MSSNLTADALSKSGAKASDLDCLVKQHLDLLNIKINRSDRTWGRNVVAYELPTNLALPGLSKQDVERIVYSRIIKDLTERKFEVRILLEERSLLFVAWTTDIDAADVEEMNKTIQAHLISPAELDKFLGTGGGLGTNLRVRPGAQRPAPRGDGKPGAAGGGPRGDAPRDSARG